MPHSTPSFPCGYTGCTSWYLSCSQPRLLKVPLSLQIHQEPLPARTKWEESRLPCRTCVCLYQTWHGPGIQPPPFCIGEAGRLASFL